MHIQTQTHTLSHTYVPTVATGAIGYLIFHTQNSLSRRIKRLSLTRHSSNGRKTDLNHAYSFVKMHGPKMKGFAEMAVAKATGHELVPPHPAPTPSSYSKPTISPRLVVAAKNGGSHLAPIPTIIVGDDKSTSPSPVHVHGHSSSPPIAFHERSHSSPVGSPGSDEAYYSTASPSYCSVMEAEDFRQGSRPGSAVLTRHSSRDSFLSNDSMLDSRHERSQSFTGPVRDSDSISVASATSSASSKGILLFQGNLSNPDTNRPEIIALFSEVNKCVQFLRGAVIVVVSFNNY